MKKLKLNKQVIATLDNSKKMFGGGGGDPAKDGTQTCLNSCQAKTPLCLMSFTTCDVICPPDF